MQLGRTRILFLSWIACCAVLLGSLAPVFSHVLQSGSAPEGWIEVCTARGTQWVRADGETAPAAPAAPVSQAMEHCAWCSVHTPMAPPPAPGRAVAAPPPTDGWLGRLDATLRSLRHWAAWRARAPPPPLPPTA